MQRFGSKLYWYSLTCQKAFHRVENNRTRFIHSYWHSRRGSPGMFECSVRNPPEINRFKYNNFLSGKSHVNVFAQSSSCRSCDTWRYLLPSSTDNRVWHIIEKLSSQSTLEHKITVGGTETPQRALMVRFNLPSWSKSFYTHVLRQMASLKRFHLFCNQQLDDDAVMWSNWKKKNRRTETEMSVKSRSTSLRLLLGSGNVRLNPAGKQTNWGFQGGI